MQHHDFDPGPLAEVSRQEHEGRPILVFSRHVRHPPERVWVALTVPDELCKWAPFFPSRDLSQIGDATFRPTDIPAGEESMSVVRQSVFPRLLEYTLGNDVLRWELEREGTGTRLRLFHAVEGPDWLPKVAAGWHLCVLVAERLLDGNPIGRIVGKNAKDYGWDNLHGQFAKVLGIQPAS